MRISDWSSDVCSSDLGFVSGRNHQCDRRTRGGTHGRTRGRQPRKCCPRQGAAQPHARFDRCSGGRSFWSCKTHPARGYWRVGARSPPFDRCLGAAGGRSEEHTSELQSLMRISYAVFCLKKKKKPETQQLDTIST